MSLNVDMYFGMVIADVLSSALDNYYEKSIKESKYDFLKKCFEKAVERNFKRDGEILWGKEEDVTMFIELYLRAIEKYKPTSKENAIKQSEQKTIVADVEDKRVFNP